MWNFFSSRISIYNRIYNHHGCYILVLDHSSLDSSLFLRNWLRNSPSKFLVSESSVCRPASCDVPHEKKGAFCMHRQFESFPQKSSTAADAMRYSAPYMYDAPNAFAAQPTHLRGIAPTVLKLQLTPLGLPLPHIAGPPSLGEPALPRIFNTFNPSITPAPHSLRRLCPRCAYVVALRAEALHQCNASSPLLKPTSRGKAIATGAYFKGTAFAVLDASLEVLAWTWMLPRPEDQVSIAHNGSRWFVSPGVHDGFATPPWG